jgi:Tyrosyl-DNA phosphodiesterase
MPILFFFFSLSSSWKIPNVVVIYEHMDSEVFDNGGDELAILRVQQNPNPEDHNDSVLYWKRAAEYNTRTMNTSIAINPDSNSKPKSTVASQDDIRNRFRGVTFVKRSPQEDAGSDSNPIRMNGQIPPKMRYGCHHTKMFIVGYSSGRLRVNIHTSNLRHGKSVQQLLCLRQCNMSSDSHLYTFRFSFFHRGLASQVSSSVHSRFPTETS